MDPELMTIFQNITALVEQAKQMMGGGGEEVPEEGVSPEVAESIMKYLKQMDGESDEEAPESDEVEKAEQANLSSEDEGSTATDDAEEIVGDVGEVNEENLNEIAKSIAKMLVAKKSVKKSADDKAIYKAIKQLADQQGQIEKAVENILVGLGIADQFKQANQVHKSQESRVPRNDENEIQKSLELIRQEIGLKNAQPEKPMSVQKSIAQALEQRVQK